MSACTEVVGMFEEGPPHQLKYNIPNLFALIFGGR